MYEEKQRRTNLFKYILLIVFAGIGGLLYLVSRQTIHVLDAKDKGIKDFFANASHELKTPLMAIRGYVDGWREEIVPKEKACYVIDKEIERMTELINNILEFSKLDGGVLEPHFAENDIREILYDAVSVIEALAKQKGIYIELNLPEPIIVNSDEDMLFSAFSNILTNCIRYAESIICISVNRQKASGKLKICISNDGRLISKEDAKHLFERFYKGSGGQIGIGMALSQEYIRLHGGTITVFTKDERTVFKIEI